MNEPEILVFLFDILMFFGPWPIQKLVQGRHPIQQVEMHSYFPLKIQMKPAEEAFEDKFLQQEPKSNLYKLYNDWLYRIIDTKTTEIKIQDIYSKW